MSQTEQSQNLFSEFLSLLLDNRVSLVSKLIFVGITGFYALSPIDIIPDILLPFGVIDDGGLIITASYFFVQTARQQLESRNLMSDDEKLKHDNRPIVMNNSSGCTTLGLGCMALFGGIVAMIFSGVIVLLFTGTMTFNNFVSSIGDFFGQPAVAQVTSSRTIVSGIQPLGQLVSVSVEVAQADINVAVDSGGLNLCNHNANHVSQGVVEAGVDIIGIDEEDISYDEASNTYTITLPSPAITSCRIEYIRQYERSGANPTCGYDWDNIRLLAQYESTVLFAEQTLEAGILSRAEREATIALETFIGTLTGSNIEVVYSESEGEAELPASCHPQIPNGWIFDEELQSWIETP